MGEIPPEGQRRYMAWIALNAIERWGLNPSPRTLAKMRVAVAALAPFTEKGQMRS